MRSVAALAPSLSGGSAEAMTRSLIGRMALAWSAPGASWREERAAGRGEPRLLAFAFGACLFLTLGEMAAEFLHPVVAVGEDRQAWFAARFIAGLSFFPLALYASAALIALIAKVFRGEGDWSGTRLALFWSGLVSGPVAAIIVAAGAGAGVTEEAKIAAGVLWVLLLAPMLATAHGFRAWRVLAVFMALAGVAFLLPALS